MTELHDLSALAQSTAIKHGEFSCAELAEHYLARTQRLGETVGAFITVLAEQARARAVELDNQLAGTADPQTLPPLFGVVAPVKDLDFVAGVPCTLGSRVYEQFVPPVNSAFVDRMLAAGMLVTGKTNTPEFGLPCYTENDLVPPARTPWDLARSAGGSSGGAAAAVSAGLASVAQGSDGGGSIRIPASVTGLVGIKPTRGRVTSAPLSEGVGELPVVGPLARSVADAAAFLDVLAGPAIGDPFPPPPGPHGPLGPQGAHDSFVACARSEPGRLRIGRFATPIIAETTVDPEVLATYEAATELLAELGHDIVDVERPFGPDVIPVFERVWSVGAASVPVLPGAEVNLLPLTAYLRERGRAVSGVELATAVGTMRDLSRRAIAASSNCDVVLTPTLASLPAGIGELRDDADPAADFEAQKRFTPFTAAFNVTGQPAMSLPFAVSTAGLPIGVQIVGRPYDEATLISLAAQVESRVNWQAKHPAVWQE